MSSLDDKLDNILLRAFNDVLGNNKDRLGDYVDGPKQAIKALLQEEILELVGNDTGTVHKNGLYGFTAGDEIRNGLRAELRQAINDKLGDENE